MPVERPTSRPGPVLAPVTTARPVTSHLRFGNRSRWTVHTDPSASDQIGVRFLGFPSADLGETNRFAGIWQETLAEDREILSLRARPGDYRLVSYAANNMGIR